MSGDSCTVEHNTIENFAGDGLRGLGDDLLFQYNLVMNCYDVNANHDDGFQSWSVGTGGVGTGTVYRIKLIGNTIINYVNPNQPFRGTLQGIGCFDGMFEDWVIENNVIITDHWHGITFLGAKNCRIINNTICDVNTTSPGPPWIQFGSHKNGTKSSGCLVRNNLSTSFNIDSSQGVAFDHNIKITSPYTFFVDYDKRDLHLKPGCSAIDAGNALLAPAIDIAGVARSSGSAPDIGAYEFTTLSTSRSSAKIRNPGHHVLQYGPIFYKNEKSQGKNAINLSGSSVQYTGSGYKIYREEQ